MSNAEISKDRRAEPRRKSGYYDGRAKEAGRAIKRNESQRRPTNEARLLKRCERHD
jgi:hypothetical protein